MEEIFKCFENVAIDLPWIHNTVNITKDHFNKSEIYEHVREAIHSLKWDEEECGQTADSFNTVTYELRCEKHTPPIGLYRNEYLQIEEARFKLNKQLISIEKHLLMCECIYSFSTCDAINSTMEKPSREKAKILRDRVFDIWTNIEVKSAELCDNTNSLHVFDFFSLALDELK